MLKQKILPQQVIINNTIYVADPCYSKTNNEDTLVIQNIIPGKYIPGIIYNENNVYEIYLVHESYTDVKSTEILASNKICVDSGQCGIYDYDRYNNSYYDHVCFLTDGCQRCGVLKDIGFVSCTGADAYFDCYICKDIDTNRVFKVKIKYHK